MYLAERAAVVSIAAAILQNKPAAEVKAAVRRAERTKYLRDYLRQWRKTRRREAIAYLGGRCVVCHSKHRLEFDHIDPSTKAIASNRLMTAARAAFWREINKCQLLCHTCHVAKGIAEGDYTH